MRLVHAKLTIQLVKRERDRKRDAKRRQAQQLLGRKTRELERGSPHICFFNAMLKATERTLVAKIRDLSPSDRQGTQGGYRRREVLRAERVDRILRTSPNVRQAWTGTRNADHLRDGRVQMEEAGSRPRVPVLRTAGRGLGHARWIPKKKGTDSEPGQACVDFVQSASREGESSAREPGERAQQSSLYLRKSTEKEREHPNRLSPRST